MNRLVAGAATLLLIGGPFRAIAETEKQERFRPVWSATLIGQYVNIPSPEDDDDVGGWFDQYEFTPNKGNDAPLQLGVRQAALDVFRGETAIFQSRLRSPTSNFGVTGSVGDDPFFNQRLDAVARPNGVEVDLSYRRTRTEQLRLFPNTLGPGLVFDDLSDPDDRFFRDRTGFSAEARVRPYVAFDIEGAAGSRVRPELSVRGGYESREGQRQLRFLRAPSNDWLGRSRDQDGSVAEVGGGLLVAPDGLLTLAFDFDYERLRFDDPVLTEGDLGFASPGDTRTIGFTPETDRYTGTVRFNSRVGDRAVIEGGFLVSELEQVSEYTPDQRKTALRDNRVRTYGANAAFDVRLVENLSFNGLFKYDRRENHIETDTILFDDTSQVDPFVEDWERFVVEGELELQLPGANRAGLGLKYEDVSRDLDFAPPKPRRILRENALIDPDTRIVTLYGRAAARPWRRLRLDGELGYRWAPKTGYATDLDDNLYGELRASYFFALRRPILVSGYVRGGTGKNDDITLVSGQGPVPNGTRLSRSFERSNFVTGATATLSPIDCLNLSASVFYAKDRQIATLDLSGLQRYFQDIAPIDFSRDGKSRFENEQTSVVLGLRAQLTERTDLGFSYSYTRAEAEYSSSDGSVALDLVDDNRRIESETHILDLELRHRIMQGLEVLGGYRYQKYHDEPSQPESVASVVAPFDRSTHQHTATIGVTLTSAFFER